MSFKDLLQEDIENCFFNPEELAEPIILSEIDEENDEEFIDYIFMGHLEPFAKDPKELKSLDDIFSAVDKMVIIPYPVINADDPPDIAEEKRVKREFLNRIEVNKEINVNGRDYICGEHFVDKNVYTLRLKEVGAA